MPASQIKGKHNKNRCKNRHKKKSGHVGVKKTYTNYKGYIMASHFRPQIFFRSLSDTTNLNHAKNCFVSSSKDWERERSFSSFNSLLMTVQEFFHQNNLK